MEPQSDLWLVVGLGNPGPEYRESRHNVGFMILDHLLLRGREMTWRRTERFSAEQARGRLAGRQVVLVKPQTFMNLSGRAIAPLARFHRVQAEQIVVVHDDVDLDLGRMKVKQGGGDGGHNGLRSTTQELGTGTYCRVRCGIGRPPHGDVTNHVLGGFGDQDREALSDLIERAASAVTTLMRHDLRTTMNRFNVWPPRERAETESQRPEKQGETNEQAG